MPDSAMLNQIIKYSLEIGLPVVLVLIGTLILKALLNRGMQVAEKKLLDRIEKKSEVPTEAQKRLNTLSQIAKGVLLFLLYFLAVLVLLSTLGVDIGPILAAAGVLGLAISFGSQELVKDIISGSFMLIENQIRIGDVAIINGTGGVIEDIRLRTVILRDLQGTVHVIRNGQITMTSNMTKDWSGSVHEIGVAYKEDVDKVVEVMKETAAELQKDETFGPSVIADAEIFGLDSFGDSSVNIKMRIKTKPGDQWKTGREFRRRLKYAFDAKNIEIPFPHQSIYFGEASEPIKIMMEQQAAKEE